MHLYCIKKLWKDRQETKKQLLVGGERWSEGASEGDKNGNKTFYCTSLF